MKLVKNLDFSDSKDKPIANSVANLINTATKTYSDSKKAKLDRSKALDELVSSAGGFRKVSGLERELRDKYADKKRQDKRFKDINRTLRSGFKAAAAFNKFKSSEGNINKINNAINKTKAEDYERFYEDNIRLQNPNMYSNRDNSECLDAAKSGSKSGKELDYELINKISNPQLRRELRDKVDYVYSKGRRIAQGTLSGAYSGILGGGLGYYSSLNSILDGNPRKIGRIKLNKDTEFLYDSPTVKGALTGAAIGLGKSALSTHLAKKKLRKSINNYIDAEQNSLNKSDNSAEIEDTNDSFDSIV